MTPALKRSPRRQRLVQHLHDCGARPVLEALIAVEAGAPLDGVLSDFSRLPTHVYREMGAADLDHAPPLFVLNGGRHERQA